MTDNDNQPPPDAYGTDWRAHEMVIAVHDLVKCPVDEFTPTILLEIELAASALLATLKQIRDRRVS